MTGSHINEKLKYLMTILEKEVFKNQPPDLFMSEKAEHADLYTFFMDVESKIFKT